MGQREAVANLLLVLMPMCAAFLAVIAFNIVYPAPLFWSYAAIALCGLGFILFLMAKISIFKQGKFLSFGTSRMRTSMRISYWAGYIFMAIGIFLSLAAASILQHKMK